VSLLLTSTSERRPVVREVIGQWFNITLNVEQFVGRQNPQQSQGFLCICSTVQHVQHKYKDYEEEEE
jgi:hypothetical protein